MSYAQAYLLPMKEKYLFFTYVYTMYIVCNIKCLADHNIRPEVQSIKSKVGDFLKNLWPSYFLECMSFMLFLNCPKSSLLVLEEHEGLSVWEDIFKLSLTFPLGTSLNDVRHFLANFNLPFS